MNRLDEISAQIADQKQPPVDRWSPNISGDIDIYIDAQGHWFHEGERIKRQPLVELFASILWFENEEYFLVTPIEKWRIKVADVPFVIQETEFLNGQWVVRTNTNNRVIVSADHPVILKSWQGQKIPYVRIRYDLWGRINRSIYTQWVDAGLDAMSEAEDQAETIHSVSLTSGDYRFVVAET